LEYDKLKVSNVKQLRDHFCPDVVFEVFDEIYLVRILGNAEKRLVH